jgi:predicted ABC-type ATPase
VTKVRKYNPNHGPDGRFARGVGGFAGRLKEPDGGFSLDLHTGQEPKKGFALSIHPEASVPIRGALQMKPKELARQLRAYAESNRTLLAQPGNLLGGWTDPETGTAWLDISTLVPDRKSAHDLALSHDQIAYFDIGAGKSIDVNRMATSGQVSKADAKMALGSFHRMCQKHWAQKVNKYNHNHGADGKFSSGPGAGDMDMKLAVDPHAPMETEDGSIAGGAKMEAKKVTLATAKADVKIAQESIENVINTDRIGDVKIVKGHNPDPSTQAWYNPQKPGQLVYNDIVTDTPGSGSDTAFSMTHEFGHLLDFEYMNVGEGSVLGGRSMPGSTAWDPESSSMLSTIDHRADIFKAQKHLSDVLLASPSVQELQYAAAYGGLSKDQANYFLSPPEAFARAFSQYVATKSGKDSTLYKQMDAEREAGILGQWQDKEFEPISDAMDGVMKAYGMYKAPVTKYNHNHGKDGRFSSADGGSIAADMKPGVEYAEGLRKSSISGKYVDANGNFTPERQALHDQIIQNFLADVPSRDHPVMYMNGGGPAAGKSSMTKGVNKSKLGYPDVRTVDDATGEFIPMSKRPGAVLVDPDAIKLQLPEVRAALKSGDTTWAAESHEESSFLGKRLMQAAMEQHKSIILDGTGDSGPDVMLAKVAAAKARGYRVESNYLYVNAEEGVKRAMARTQHTGRMVPPSIIRKTYAQIPAVFQAMQTSHDVDTIRLFANDGPIGSPARLIGEGGGGQFTLHDPATYNAFVSGK